MTKEEQSVKMGKRLKILREKTLLNGKKMSHVELKKKLKELYGIEISRDSLMNYEVSDINHSKFGTNLKMSAEYLNCLARFYRVSTDFLLGLSDVDTTNPTLRAVCEYTKLPVETVNVIMRICSTDEGFATFYFLLKSYNFYSLIDALQAYLQLSIDTGKSANSNLLLKLDDYVREQSDGAIHAVPAQLERDMTLFNAQRYTARAADEMVEIAKKFTSLAKVNDTSSQQ